MARGIIGNYTEFEKILGADFSPKNDVERFDAVKHYFAMGGVISLAPNANDWPTIRYPNKRQLQRKLDSLIEIKGKHDASLKEWRDTLKEAQRYHAVHNMKKLKEPLYWKHVFKSMTDNDYRLDTEKVKLPVHLVSDPKWRPLVKTFLSDFDYRKQLTETVETSIVYKDNPRVAQYADVLQQFRMDQSSRKITELEKKLGNLQQTENSLNVLLRWAPP